MWTEVVELVLRLVLWDFGLAGKPGPCILVSAQQFNQ